MLLLYISSTACVTFHVLSQTIDILVNRFCYWSIFVKYTLISSSDTHWNSVSLSCVRFSFFMSLSQLSYRCFSIYLLFCAWNRARCPWLTWSTIFCGRGRWLPSWRLPLSGTLDVPQVVFPSWPTLLLCWRGLFFHWLLDCMILVLLGLQTPNLLQDRLILSRYSDVNIIAIAKPYLSLDETVHIPFWLMPLSLRVPS